MRTLSPLWSTNPGKKIYPRKVLALICFWIKLDHLSLNLRNKHILFYVFFLSIMISKAKKENQKQKKNYYFRKCGRPQINFLSIFRRYFLFLFSFFCFLFCLFVCFLKLKIYILIHIQLCRRVSNKNIFISQFLETRLLSFWPNNICKSCDLTLVKWEYTWSKITWYVGIGMFYQRKFRAHVLHLRGTTFNKQISNQ